MMMPETIAHIISDIDSLVDRYRAAVLAGELPHLRGDQLDITIVVRPTRHKASASKGDYDDFRSRQKAIQSRIPDVWPS